MTELKGKNYTVKFAFYKMFIDIFEDLVTKMSFDGINTANAIVSCETIGKSLIV